MVRNAVDRIIRVAKGAVLLVGFAAIFAVVFAVANALLGGGTSFPEGSYRADPGTQQAASGGAGPGLARGWPRSPWRGGGR